MVGTTQGEGIVGEPAHRQDRPDERDDEVRRPLIRRLEIPIFVGCALAVISLAMVGFRRAGLGIRDAIYSTAQLFVLEYNVAEGHTGWGLEVARLLAPVLSGYAVVRAALALFSEQVRLVRLRFRHGHVIVAGLGDKGWALVRSLCRAGWRVAVIEHDPANERVESARALGAAVLVGDARDAVLLDRIAVDRARHLVAVCGDDATNVEVVVRAAERVADEPGPILECRAHIRDTALCHLLMTHELVRHRNPRYQIEYFNLFERSAHDLVSGFAPWPSPPGSIPHVVVGGGGALAEHVVLQLGQEWSSCRRSTDEQMVISLLDGDLADRLVERYPTLASVCDLRTGLDVHAPPLSIAYLCDETDSAAVSAALALLPSAGPVPVVACVRHASGLGSLLTGRRPAEYRQLHAFGVLDETCDQDLLRAGVYESIARALHAEYVRNERKAGRTTADNPSMASWRYLPASLRESNRQHANHIGAKLASVGCRLEPLVDWNAEPICFTDGEVEFLAKLEHERWVEERISAGWRPGPVKDVAAKQTPYLVDWAELSEDVREYDRIFIRRLPVILADAGFRVIREADVPGLPTLEPAAG